MTVHRTFSCLALAALAFVSQAQDKSSAIKQIVEDYLTKNKVVGASVAILQADGKSFQAGYGWQDREGGVQASEKTIYRLASISKTVTAVAAMQLVESGKMSLTGDCRNYAPEWPTDKPVISLQNLLTHTSGIRHYAPGKEEAFHEHFTPAKALDLFKDDPLLFNPGEKFSYSTHAFTLVARMVEFASKEEFGKYVYSYVSIPAKAPTLRLEDRSVANKNRSQLYEIVEKSELVKPEEVEDISWKCGGGGFESSAPDLARFGMAAMKSKLLKPETTNLMFTDQKALGAKRSLGWGLTQTGDPTHGGAQQGCKTYLYLDLKRQTVYVIMTNTYSEANPSDIFPAIRKIWVGK